MSGVLYGLATPGPSVGLHAVFLSSIVTGTSVLLTAGDLGPLSPMLLALGFYAIEFGVLAELIVGVRWLSARWARGAIYRSNARVVTGVDARGEVR